MNVTPLLSTLRRHKTAAGLIALEIALTCAIVSNAVFIIGNRLERMSMPSGIALDELVYVQVVGISKDTDTQARVQEDLLALGSLPGVRSVATTNQIPYGGSSWYSTLNLQPDQTHPTLTVSPYLGSRDLLETLGLELVAGRAFEPDDYLEFDALQSGGGEVPTVIITRAVAQRLFPDGTALGQSLYIWGEQPQRVVGVVDRLSTPGDAGGPSDRGLSVLMPVTAPTLYGSNYLLRTDPSRRDEVLAAAVAELERIDPNRIVLKNLTKTLEAFRDDYYQQDRAMAWLLVAVCAALLIVTALGIVGLASFWVQQRTRQIGIRRALGATRGQIVRYFQAENLIIAGFGIALGMALAYGINGMLMARYELPRLPWHYLPVGAVVLFVLGQLAVLGPALRAAAVPPAVATRSV